MSPGNSAGAGAAAMSQIKALMNPLHQILGALPVGSKEYKSVLKALNALQPVFGAPEEGNTSMAAIQNMAKGAQQGQSPIATTAPGLKPNIPPPTTGAPGGPGGGAADLMKMAA